MYSMQPKNKKSALELIAFKIDVETLAMLDELCADLDAATKASGDTFGGRSHTIRKAIRFAHASRPWSPKS
jgi:hypothetical protein